ncbi:MAG: fused MFS/spermidine synthase, partial [Candidatus Altiarchaeota archaeon]
MRDGFLLLVAFAGGAVIMGLEFSASRVLAPFFGYSIYVWGALLGVIMGALALGYFLGGWLIDRSPREDVLFKVILAAFLLTVAIPVYDKKLILLVEDTGTVYGSMLATTILFSFPMTLLAMISPMIIRLKTKAVSELGVSSGVIYAVSTIGSIFGTFATAFYLIPTYGTKTTILIASTVLLAVSLAGLARRKYVPLAAFILVVLLIPQQSSPNVIYQTESEYSLIKVLDEGDVMRLAVNQDRWSQTVAKKDSILTGGYIDYFNLGPVLADVGEVLIIGVAGGGSVRQLRHFYPGVAIDAVEIDPTMIEVAEAYFNLSIGEGVRVIVEDGRTYLRKTERKYDFIEVDVFSGGPNIPYYLATREFFESAYGHMTDDGVLMMNVLSIGAYLQLADVVSKTVASVFPSVYVVDRGVNQIIVAYKKKTPVEEYLRPLRGVSGELAPVANHTLYHTRLPRGPDMVLTDDHAPIEGMIHEMLEIPSWEEG